MAEQAGRHVGLLLLALAAVTVLMLSAGASERNQSFGPHDLNGIKANSRERTELCAFCHTPSGAGSGEPQWNGNQVSTSFETFDTRTDGTVFVTSNVSIACLSCHDGTQAPDVAARSGIIDASDYPYAPQLPAGSDHPVGIEFTGRTLDKETLELRFQTALIDGERRWWIDLEAVPNGMRDKTDVVFYNSGGVPRIECASCHDPHANPGNLFLRVSNEGSRLCLTCHSV